MQKNDELLSVSLSIGIQVFFNWDSLHTRLNSLYKARSYKKKKHKKINAYRESLEKEPTVNRCLLNQLSQFWKTVYQSNTYRKDLKLQFNSGETLNENDRPTLLLQVVFRKTVTLQNQHKEKQQENERYIEEIIQENI